MVTAALTIFVLSIKLQTANICPDNITDIEVTKLHTYLIAL
jgi:hypothetical protein